MPQDQEPVEFRKIDEYRWEIPQTGAMRVPGLIYADEGLMQSIRHDNAPQQVKNVACLPGIIERSLAMPDIHWGYGFPIGGVAATDPQHDGVISPGGVGYDICCGVRLHSSNLTRDALQPNLRKVVDALYNTVPAGVGSHGAISKLSAGEQKQLLAQGARWALDHGYGDEADLAHIEEGGSLPAADPEAVGPRAIERGLKQVGTLGSGNHFLEVSYVDRVFDPVIAETFGLWENQIVVLIHSGSRGLGYQVCSDYLEVMERAVRKYDIRLPDRQLACAPIRSPEGERYFAAMSCAANYAWANRQCITQLARRSFQHALGMGPGDLGMRLVYDNGHNIAKFEEHVVAGRRTQVCVHRKGATRAFGPGHPQLAPDHRDVGQPVIIPGDMGTASYVCAGTQRALEETFGSSAHGAGRVMSRSQAKKRARGRGLQRELEDRGVYVRSTGHDTLAEEMPEAYKDVDQVVEAISGAGLVRKVARFRPIGVVKG